MNLSDNTIFKFDPFERKGVEGYMNFKMSGIGTGGGKNGGGKKSGGNNTWAIIFLLLFVITILKACAD
jgi:hypothetical protein